jgi:hypothetical protein
VLLAAGANPRAKFRFSNDGPDAPLLITPLLFATQHNDSSIAKLLLGIPTEESGATAKEKAI